MKDESSNFLSVLVFGKLACLCISCGHNLGVDRVHNTWPKLSLIIKCISLPCLS